MGTIGDALGGSILRYAESGGTCKRPDCDADAPVVVMVGRRLDLPCPDHAAEEEAEEARVEREYRAEKFMRLAGGSRRLARYSLATFRRDCGDDAGLAALAVAERWLKTYRDTGAGTNLLFYGPVGSGKTGLAWSMVRDLCEDGFEAKLVNFRKLLEDMKDCYSRKEPTTHAFDVGRVPVLVLDDLGSERPTEWACGEFLGIVDHRYERGLPTIYISNYDPGVLGKRLGHNDPLVGERILSRMTEGATQHRFRADDRRRAVAS